MAEKTVKLNGITCVVTDCVNCGIPFTVPLLAWETQQRDGGYHYCPNGHCQGWSKDTCEMGRLRRERDCLKQQVAQWQDEASQNLDLAQHHERSAAAYKSHVTRLKKRAKAGLCPCCNRHFNNLERHMATKHPGMEPDEPLRVIEGGRPG